VPLLKPDTRYIFFAVELVPTRSGAGTVEAWAHCERVENGDNTSFIFYPLINRSPSLAAIRYHADSGGLRLYGCELDFKVARAKRAKYFIDLSIITPYVTNTTDGKAPDLTDFGDAIAKVVCKTANEAYRNMVRPPSAMAV